MNQAAAADEIVIAIEECDNMCDDKVMGSLYKIITNYQTCGSSDNIQANVDTDI